MVKEMILLKNEMTITLRVVMDVLLTVKLKKGMCVSVDHLLILTCDIFFPLLL